MRRERRKSPPEPRNAAARGEDIKACSSPFPVVPMSCLADQRLCPLDRDPPPALKGACLDSGVTPACTEIIAVSGEPRARLTPDRTVGFRRRNHGAVTTLGGPRAGSQHRARADRSQREGAVRRSLGAPGTLQARPQPDYLRDTHRARPRKTARRASAARSRQRPQQERAQRSDLSPRLLRRLAGSDDRGARRQGRVREEIAPIDDWNGRREGDMKIGFIGLGMMGSGMAANLQNAGHDLIVHDLRRAAAEPYLAAGATWAD